MESEDGRESGEPSPSPPPPYYGSSEETDSTARSLQYIEEPSFYDLLFESYRLLDFFFLPEQVSLEQFTSLLKLIKSLLWHSVSVVFRSSSGFNSDWFSVQYMFDCPVEHFIPIYLVVDGCVGLITTFTSFVDRCQRQRIDENDRHHDHRKYVSRINALLSCFLFAWFITGNVWVYRTHGRFTTQPNETDYCHPVLYSFAFWLTTATYIIFVIFFVCSFVSSFVSTFLPTSRSFLSNSQRFEQSQS